MVAQRLRSRQLTCRDGAPKTRHQGERFPAKACHGLDPGWIPVRVKKTRQIEDQEPINAENAAFQGEFDG
jgi:hypothetical protein